MCNAYNHSSYCRCGWGGEGHVGKRTAGTPAIQNDYFRKNRYDSYVNPNARCPVCGAAVYFYKSENGRVFFDDLGPPWLKHPCTDVNYNRAERIYYVGTTQRKWEKDGWVPVIVDPNPRKSSFAYFITRLDKGYDNRLEIMWYDSEAENCCKDDVLNYVKALDDSTLLLTSYNVSKDNHMNFEIGCDSTRLKKFLENVFKDYLAARHKT
jgi:hypothetical protein